MSARNRSPNAMRRMPASAGCAVRQCTAKPRFVDRVVAGCWGMQRLEHRQAGRARPAARAGVHRMPCIEIALEVLGDGGQQADHLDVPRCRRACRASARPCRRSTTAARACATRAASGRGHVAQLPAVAGQQAQAVLQHRATGTRWSPPGRSAGRPACRSRWRPHRSRPARHPPLRVRPARARQRWNRASPRSASCSSAAKASAPCALKAKAGSLPRACAGSGRLM